MAAILSAGRGPGYSGAAGVGQAGWDVLAALALGDNDLADAFFEERLATIESSLHESASRVRYAMNNALIAIGLRSPKLEKKAIATARRIGKVKVDHGETGCKTPDAVSYIHRAKARKRSRKAAPRRNG